MAGLIGPRFDRQIDFRVWAPGPRLSEWCIGTINEVFDAEAPFAPRGCVAQAWSVAEILRCLVKTAD